ncbi:MAG: nucleotidyltransferase domain-containing protein [Candidatus Tectomicrobia bacterium]|nr:nucleotidyltransferase domain-containing protein [Candidatus Tectomicrobia bacterium]
MLSEATRQVTDKALESFVQQTVELAGRALQEIILFGSWARGDASDESDVDLLIVLEGDGALREAVRTLRTDLIIETDVIVSLVFMSPEQYAVEVRRSTSFMRFVIEEGRTLYDRNDAEPDNEVQGVC